MFSKDSAWQKPVSPPDPATRPPGFPVRHVGQANIIEIPVDKLEEWISDLDALAGLMHMSSATQSDLETLADDMRSYFRG